MYGGHDYGIELNDGNVAAGETLTVSGAFLETLDSLMVDGSAERDGFLTLYGGDANDLLIGGRRGDYIQGNEGGDTLNGGKGRDAFGYAGGANESQSGDYDTIVGFNFDNTDAFDMTFEVTGTDTVGNGALSHATFADDLKAAMAGNLLAAQAVLFTPDAGDLTGEVFLIVDADGKDGYKATLDYVIHLQDSVNLGLLDVSDFI
jgi:Ca2+-binding RTX toxin-like protein